MDFGFLILPFLTGAFAFGLAVFNNVEAVNIEQLNVPAAVTDKSGYTADVVIKHLVDRMHRIEDEAQSRADARQVIAQDSGGSAAALGDYFKLTPLLRVVQTGFGLIPFTLSGEIVVNGKALEIVLRGRDNASAQETLIRQEGPSDDLPGLLDRAAYEAMRMVDPTSLAAYQFKRDYLTRNFAATQDVIRRALATGDPSSHKWVLNLWGIVLYQEADFDGAIDKFRAALERDPAFTSALLNWGVVLTHQGKPEQAIAKFQQAVASWRRGDPADTLAAALTEWGFALALLGREEQAFAKFREAAAADPTFSDVYVSWAEVLSAKGGRSEEAQKMTMTAVHLAPVETVYTDNLVGRIQKLPATAASH